MKNANSLMLGYLPNRHRYSSGPGFVRPAEPGGDDDLITSSEGHLITVAPTGSGKRVSSVIPALLTYPGACLVIDPKGENYRVTAAYRKKMENEIVLLDPFSVVDEKSDSFNPLDIIDKGKDHLDSIKSFSDEFMTNFTSKDSYWDTAARQLMCVLIAHAFTSPLKHDHTIARVCALANMPSKNIIQMIQNLKRRKDKYLSEYLQSFPQVDRTFDSILSVLRAHLDGLMSRRVEQVTNSTSFSLNHFKAGKKMTIYLVIPPAKLDSARGLLRVWIGALFSIITERRKMPANDTLFILDECAQVGSMKKIEQAITLLRGYGCRVWSIWQDFEQLKSTYPESWKTLINNSDVLQMFGFSNASACQTAIEMVGEFLPSHLLGLASDQQILQLKGRLPIQSQKINYLTDEYFKGRFKPNDFYTQRTHRNTKLTLAKAS